MAATLTGYLQDRKHDRTTWKLEGNLDINLRLKRFCFANSSQINFGEPALQVSIRTVAKLRQWIVADCVHFVLYNMQCRLNEWRRPVVISCTNVVRKHGRKRLTEESDSEESLFETVFVRDATSFSFRGGCNFHAFSSWYNFFAKDRA